MAKRRFQALQYVAIHRCRFAGNLQFHLFAKLAWNPRRDVEAILDAAGAAGTTLALRDRALQGHMARNALVIATTKA